MPIYDYSCPLCHQNSSHFVSIAQRHSDITCSHCKQGQLQRQISAPRSLQFKDSKPSALTPQQQLAGLHVEGPGTRAGARSSVLHNCKGPSCSVCASA